MGERENAAGLATRLHAWMPRLTAVAVVLLGVLCIEALRHLAADLRYDEVVDAVRNTSLLQLVLAVAATAVSFIALTGYDRSGLAFVGADVPYRVVGQASFIDYAVGNSIGLGMLTGGA